jgi:SH3-like domain-containing protein
MEAGVVAWLDSCVREWCEIEVSGLSGWVHRSAIWGVRVDESLR